MCRYFIDFYSCICTMVCTEPKLFGSQEIKLKPNQILEPNQTVQFNSKIQFGSDITVTEIFSFHLILLDFTIFI